MLVLTKSPHSLIKINLTQEFDVKKIFATIALMVATIGKWAPYVGTAWIGTTDIQLGETSSV